MSKAQNSQNALAVREERISGARERERFKKLGRYILVERLAVGGMGEVHLAQLEASGGFRKWVAVKLIHPEVSESPRFVQMFRREANLSAKIDHPNVCTVFDFGETDGTWFLAMEFLHGQPLSTLLDRAVRSGGIPFVTAARIVADAAMGIHAAHSLTDVDGAPAPVVHRDVSPHNVFVLYTGVTKVVDFGIARAVESPREFTRTGEVRGKPAYMAPEQARGLTPVPSMDIWALGVVLWEVTMGRRLFRRPSDAESVAAVLTEAIQWPADLFPGFPAELDKIIRKALDRDPEKRYATMADMARDLENYIASAGVPGGSQADVATTILGLFGREKTDREQSMRVEVQSPTRNFRVSPPRGLVLVDRARSTVPDKLTPVADPTPTPTPAPRPAASPLVLFGAGLLLGLTALVGGVAVGRLRAAHSNPTVARPTVTVPLTVVQPAIERPAVNANPSPEALAAPAVAPVVVAQPAHPALRPAVRPTVRSVEAPATPTTPAQVEGRGYLTLRSEIRCEVFLGSRSLGHTPIVDRTLPPGHLTLRLVPDDGSPEQSVDVDLDVGATSVFTARW